MEHGRVGVARLVKALAEHGLRVRVEHAPAWGASVVTVSGARGYRSSMAAVGREAEAIRRHAADLGIDLTAGGEVVSHARVTGGSRPAAAVSAARHPRRRPRPR
jgi:hypothetical protein